MAAAVGFVVVGVASAVVSSPGGVAAQAPPRTEPEVSAPGPALTRVVVGARARRVPLATPQSRRWVPLMRTTTSAPSSPLSIGSDADVDLVSISDIGVLDASTAELAHGVARRAGGASAAVGYLGVGLTLHRRGTQRLDDIAPGWAVPVAVSVLDPDVATPVLGTRVGGTIAWGAVVMSSTAADLRGAQAGDVVGFRAVDGSTVEFVIGAVLPDEVVGGAEVIISVEAASRLGPVRITRVLVWGARSRATLEEAIDESGLSTRRETRVRRSWDPPDPDSTLGLLETKVRLGEFRYQIRDDGRVQLDPGWIASNITDGGERRTYSGVGIRTACHVVVAADLERALAEIAAQGLAGAIDVANTNRYGGCYYPRFNRIAGSLGVLSRHSWGMALDVNTVTNAQGAVPQLDCRVVVIMRRHGFAWGGNFTRPDGMHFEWVGEPRDGLEYPSRYCPNPTQPSGDDTVVDTGASSLSLDSGKSSRRLLVEESLTGFGGAR